MNNPTPTNTTPTQACNVHEGDEILNAGTVTATAVGPFGQRIITTTARTIKVGATALLFVVEPDEYVGCECEMDWRCPHHAGLPTFLETRYWGMDEDEARAHGVWEREFGMGVAS